MTFGSLFSGIGGMDLGLERAGMTCKWQVEIDEFCRKVLAERFTGVTTFADIKAVRRGQLEPVDLIAGGYPCQPFSLAGKRAGEDDPRHLWPQFRRIICDVRPRYALLENVPGHLSLGFGKVLSDLARLRYDAEWLCLRASDFGASHLRKRVFIVAHRTLGGRRELRESSGGRGFVDGGGEAVDDSKGIRSRTRWPRDGFRSPEDVACNGEHMAYSPDNHGRGGIGAEEARVGENGIGRRRSSGGYPTLADPGNRQLPQQGRGPEGRDGAGSAGADVSGVGLANPAHNGQGGRVICEDCGRNEAIPIERGGGDGFGVFAPGPNDPRWPAILAECPWLAPSLESPVRGVADGVSSWLDRAMSNRTKRLGRLGNAVVPQVAQWLGERILEAERTL